MKALWCWLMHRRYRCPDRRLYEMVRHSVDMPFCLRCEPPQEEPR